MVIVSDVGVVLPACVSGLRICPSKSIRAYGELCCALAAAYAARLASTAIGHTQAPALDVAGLCAASGVLQLFAAASQPRCLVSETQIWLLVHNIEV